MRHFLSAVLLIVLVFGILIEARAQGEITLLATGPARRPIDQIIEKFQAKTKYKVKVTYGPGMTTRQSVAKGQALDLSLIIPPYPGAIASGTIIPGSATPIASLLTAMAVPKGARKPDISTPDALKKTLLEARAIGYEEPDFTVAGEAAYSVLTRLGIADQVATKSKVMLGPMSAGISPTATAGAISTTQRLQDKDVDLGMFFISDMLVNQDKYDIVGVLPREVSPPTPIIGFISTKASDPAGAKALLDYLASPEAQAVFKEAGLEPHR